MNYWDTRYKNGGNSGSGSAGILAKYKADILNDYIKTNNIQTVLDLGCGDGYITELLIGYTQYIGYDISVEATRICKQKFPSNTNKVFTNNVYILPIVDLVISLDVLYHIIDYEDFKRYISTIFTHTNKHVIIYSSNIDKPIDIYNSHILHREFLSIIEEYHPCFRLINILANPYPDKTSANFFIFQKQLN